MRCAKRASWLLLVVLALLVGCRQEGSPSHPTAVRVAFLPISASEIFFVAQDQGYFARRSLKIVPLRVTSANQALDAMIAGDVDVAVMLGFTTLLPAAAKDPNLFRIIQSAAETETRFTARILVPPDSPMQSLADLRGKTIGTYSGLTQKLNVELTLRSILDPHRDITIIQVEPALQVQALAARRFDALFTIDPYATAALKRGVARVLVDNPRYKYILKPFPTCGTVVSYSFARDNAKPTHDFRLALNEARRWADAHPKEAARLVARPQYAAMPEEIAMASGRYEWWNLGEENRDAVKRLAVLLRDYGTIKGLPATDQLFLSDNPLQ